MSQLANSVQCVAKIRKHFSELKKCVCVFFLPHIEEWSPIFTGYDGTPNKQVPGFWFAVGIPQCSQKQMWPIYYYPTVNTAVSINFVYTFV